MITERELRELVVTGLIHPVGNTEKYHLTEQGRAMRRALATVAAAHAADTEVKAK